MASVENGNGNQADPEQVSFFDDPDAYEEWQEVWQSMPEFKQNDLTPTKSIIVHFASQADLAAFADLVDQTVTLRTQSIWYPKAEIDRMVDKRFIDHRLVDDDRPPVDLNTIEIPF